MSWEVKSDPTASCQLILKPSPLSSVIGFIDDPLKIRSLLSQKKSNIILSIGITNEELGGSEYYEQIHKVVGGKVPQVDFKYEKRLHEAYLRVSEEELIDASIDCSQGGIATALSEICIENNLGAKISFKLNDSSIDRKIFGY